MEKKNYADVISSCRITHYVKNGVRNGFPSVVWMGFAEKSDLMDKLFTYCEQLGVDGYDEDHNGVAWSIRNNWYTTDQIERMLALKAFA